MPVPHVYFANKQKTTLSKEITDSGVKDRRYCSCHHIRPFPQVAIPVGYPAN
jgi:hypothetical protein